MNTNVLDIFGWVVPCCPECGAEMKLDKYETEFSLDATTGSALFVCFNSHQHSEYVTRYVRFNSNESLEWGWVR